MENTDIPQFRTYRGEIELEGVVIQVDVFVDNEMLEDRNSFLISFLCKSNTIYEMICRNISKSKEYYVILKFNGVKSKLRSFQYHKALLVVIQKHIESALCVLMICTSKLVQFGPKH